MLSANATNICGTNATLGNAVMAALNFTYPGLEAVAAAAGAGDLNTACEELAAYYQAANTSWWLRIPPVKPGNGMAGGYADDIVLRDWFWLAGVDLGAVIPRNPDGGLDWLDRGPRDDPEFQNCLNRHDSFVELFQAWQATGNPIYAAYFDRLIQDWVTHLPCPSAQAGKAPCTPLGADGPHPVCTWEGWEGESCATGTFESPWRSLEMGIRMGGFGGFQWPTAFFGFQHSPNFTTSARVLMVLGVAQHNEALAADGGHPGSGTPNWEMTQWQGLVTSTVAWPELKNTDALRQLALGYLRDLLASQVYPDGVETEQASDYDMGTAGDFYGTLQMLRDAGAPPAPQAFEAHVEAMWEYGTYVSDPRGCLPRNGDSDLCGNGYSANVTAYFDRPDWTYAHTNGAQGSPPPWLSTQGPSSVFPWAGQVALRSGFGAQASWMWFDVGPYGSSGHAHRDKLGFHLHARGAMLLVDSGRFAYAGTDLSATLHVEYGRNASAHNTLAIDGCDQLPLPPVATAPIANETFSLSPAADAVYGSMSAYDPACLKGNATHTRGVYFYRPAAVIAANGDAEGDWAVVVDVVTGDRPRSVQARFHAHPNASIVSTDAATLVTTVGGVDGATGLPTPAQVCIVPAQPGAGAPPLAQRWNRTSMARGQYANATTGVEWAGWYSQSYDDAWAATVVTYEAQAVRSGGAFAWLLVPSGSPQPCSAHSITVLAVQPGAVTVQVAVAGQPGSHTVTVPVVPTQD